VPPPVCRLGFYFLIDTTYQLLGLKNLDYYITLAICVAIPYKFLYGSKQEDLKDGIGDREQHEKKEPI
jgi:hypothetical protein